MLAFTIIKSKWILSSYLLGLYLLTLFLSLFIHEFFPLYEDSKESALAFCVGISLFIFPYMRKRPLIIAPQDSNKAIRKVSIIVNNLCLPILILCIMCIPAIVAALQVGFSDIRDVNYEIKVSVNPITAIAIKFLDMFSPLSFVLLTLFFYSFTFIKISPKSLSIIFLSSLSAPYYGMTAGGRTQMIYWVLSLIFNVLLFHPYFSSKQKKIIYKVIIIIISVITVYLGIATIARFSDSKWDTGGSLMLYAGQSYINFCHFYDNYQNIGFTLHRIFPFTHELLGLIPDDYVNLIKSKTGYDIGIFYTLLGDLFVDVGKNGMFLYCLIYFLYTKHFLKNDTLSLSHILLLVPLFMIPLHGVFYYSFWKRQVTFCVMLTIFLSKKLKNI